MEERAHQLLMALEEAGFEAYVVGGAVRDLLMGRTPHDYDIATSARPDDIRRVAEEKGWHTAEINAEAFGIVVVVLEGQPFEVATFRGESYGTDSHRPESVWYAESLREDVLRRDFTVNALAMDRSGEIYDYVGGRKDLKKKRLVTVGDPVRRFQEDALRLFRLCRFAGQLDFMASKETVAAMPSAFDRVSGLSLERVVSELDRLMVTPASFRGLDILVRSGLAACSCRQKENGVYTAIPILPELGHLPDTPQSKPFHLFDAWVHTLATVAHTPPDLTVRYAALFHDIAKGLPGIRGEKKGRYTDYCHDSLGADMAKEILLRWRKKPAFADRVAWLVKTHMKFHFLPIRLKGTSTSGFAAKPCKGLFTGQKNWLKPSARRRRCPSAISSAAAGLTLIRKGQNPLASIWPCWQRPCRSVRRISSMTAAFLICVGTGPVSACASC